MAALALACLFFLAIHVLISGSPLRGRLVAALGERAYLAGFSLLSIAGLTWVILAYGTARATAPLWWSAPRWLHLPATAVLLAATLLVVLGLTTPSPTATGGAGHLARPDAARGILRVTRHPFLWGVALWASMHLLLNGDAASVWLFGTLLALALMGPPLIDARRRRAHGADWQRFAAVTSSVPFAAIAARRNTLSLGEIRAWQWAAGLAAFALLVAMHRWAFGVAAIAF